MKHKEFTIKSFDNLKLFGQAWLPDSKIVAVVNLIHGIGEHSTRYSQMAEYYTQKNIAIYAIDYRGHGKSEGKRGHTTNYECLMKDIDSLLYFSKNDNNCENIFLYGHSLGGNLVINYTLRRNPKIKGLIASAPWLKLGFEPPKIKVNMGKFIRGIFPKFTQRTGFNKSDLSKNIKNIEIYEKDNLVHDKISVSLFFGAYDAANLALNNAEKMTIPFLLMHGNEDKMTSPEGSKEFASKSEKTELKIWEGLFHEIHNEENNLEVYNFVINWITDKTRQ